MMKNFLKNKIENFKKTISRLRNEEKRNNFLMAFLSSSLLSVATKILITGYFQTYYIQWSDGKSFWTGYLRDASWSIGIFVIIFVLKIIFKKDVNEVIRKPIQENKQMNQEASNNGIDEKSLNDMNTLVIIITLIILFFIISPLSTYLIQYFSSSWFLGTKICTLLLGLLVFFKFKLHVRISDCMLAWIKKQNNRSKQA